MESRSTKFIVVLALVGILAVGAFPQDQITPQMPGQGMPQGVPSGQGGQDGMPGMPGVPAAPGVPGFNFSRSFGFGG